MKPRWDATRLERAESIARSFEATQRVMWPSLWPHGACMVSSLALAPLLRMALEWDVAVAVGSAGSNKAHAWIETPDGDVLDPTYGQFDYGDALRIVPVSNAGSLGHRPVVRLTIDQEEYYRRAIRSVTGPRGWDPGATIETLFGDNPHISPHLS